MVDKPSPAHPRQHRGRILQGRRSGVQPRLRARGGLRVDLHARTRRNGRVGGVRPLAADGNGYADSVIFARSHATSAERFVNLEEAHQEIVAKRPAASPSCRTGSETDAFPAEQGLTAYGNRGTLGTQQQTLIVCRGLYLKCYGGKHP